MGMILTGPRGPQGFTPYDIAVQQGFVGTPSEWLLTLVGPQGDAGGDAIAAINDVAAMKALATVHAVGTVLKTEAGGYAYEVVDGATPDPHLITASGLRLMVHPSNQTVNQFMFDVQGVQSVGDLAIVGHAAIPDEFAKLQSMFDFMMLHDKAGVILGGSQGIDIGIGSQLVFEPQISRNKGNTTAVLPGPQLLHFSNTPKIKLTTVGNVRIVVKAAMPSAILMRGEAGVNIAPYWNEFRYCQIECNGLAPQAIDGEWCYRTHYTGNRWSGCEKGIVSKWAAGDVYDHNNISASIACIDMDNAGDAVIFANDFFCQKDGVDLGGGNNVKILANTFTAEVHAALDMVGVRLFSGSTVTANPRTRGAWVRDNEFIGFDWAVKGEDEDADGLKEMWSLTVAANTVIRNTARPDMGLIYVKNAKSVTLEGNFHGDLVNEQTASESVFLIGVENVSIIGDHFNKTAGRTVYCEGVLGLTMTGCTFQDCGMVNPTPIVELFNTLDSVVSANTVRWSAAPAATAFVAESGTSNRNEGAVNRVDTTRMVRPYIGIGAQSFFAHKYRGQKAFVPGVLADGASISTTVSLNGLRKGDVLNGHFSVDDFGVDIKVKYSADDLAHVEFRNATGAEVTLTAGQLIVSAVSQ